MRDQLMFFQSVLKHNKFKPVVFGLCIAISGWLCACSPQTESKYTCEITPQKDTDESLRKELIRLLEGIVVPKVAFDNVPVLNAIDWLSDNGRQTISYIDFTTNSNSTASLSLTNATVSLSMTNASFLAVLDKICEQSDRYWGFHGRVLMTLPRSAVTEGEYWIKRASTK